MLLLATQVLAAVPAIAAVSETMPAQHDCGGAPAQHDVAKHCPHCLDVALSACASHCAAALLPAPLTLSRSAATVEFPRTTVAMLLTRYDIPPTPPPIA